VDANFPRLTRQDLPSAILRAKYELDSKELGEFLLEEEEISIDGLMGAI
jgi:hypothetical protein